MTDISASAPCTATAGNRQLTGTDNARPGILGGAMIIAGTSVGAGMFALPVYSAGMWFGWSLIMMAVAWYCAYSSGMFLAEASLNYPSGASYATIAEDTLGRPGKLLATACVAFVCFIITYAYVSGGSSMVSELAHSSLGLSLSGSASSVIFGLLLACIVLMGSRTVDRVSTIMLGGMVLTFFSSTGIMAGNASAELLFPATDLGETSPYVWMSIPVLVTSFGFHGTVPSLIKHYSRDFSRVRHALLAGTGLTLVIYVFWQLAIMGNIPRQQFTQIIADGGNVATLIGAVGQSVDVSGAHSALMLFGKLALASSFIGVTLGLLDLVKDVLKLDDSVRSTAIAGAITFVPPIALGAIAPHGFITAIGYAALAASVFVLILPALMLMVLRRRGVDHGHRVRGGKLRLQLVLASGVLAVLVEVVNQFGLLPVFG